jgi:glycosyltransferase involved in cell wall biosynthesis
MRVAFIVSDIPDHGIEFAEMMADSCDVLLCIPDKYFSPDRPSPNPRLEIAWLPWPRQRNFRNIPFMRKLAKRVRRWRPDLVHFHAEDNLWGWLLASFLNPIPIVTTVHDIIVHPGDAKSARVPRLFANALIKRSDVIIVQGEGMRRDAARLLPISQDRVFIVPLVPPLRPSERPINDVFVKPNDGLFRILFFGRLYAYKGLRYLLEAMPLVHAAVPNVRLIIAGRGDDIAQYTAHIRDFSYIEIRNRFVPRAEASRLFAEADLLVLPYVEASQSGVLISAMAFGLPVVATSVGEMRALVESTGMGLVVAPRDEKALAAAITKAALDADLRRQFSENAEKAINRQYSRPEIAARTMRVYQRLASARGDWAQRTSYSPGPSRSRQ